jgi:hypothetical protein
MGRSNGLVYSAATSVHSELSDYKIDVLFDDGETSLLGIILHYIYLRVLLHSSSSLQRRFFQENVKLIFDQTDREIRRM